MAEGQDDNERTEEPTQRRIEQAIKKGDIAKSVEVNTWFVLGGFTLALLALSGPVAGALAASLKSYLMNAHLVPSDAAGVREVGRLALVAMATGLLLPLGLIMLIAIGGGLVQHAPQWTYEPLKPKLSRISPASGLKRILGRESLAQFVKGLFKLTVVGAAIAIALWSERDRLEAFIRLDVAALLPAALDLVLKMMAGVLATLVFLAVGDYLYQRMSWLRRLRMTKRELKEEFKETEGNPEIKARVRQIRTARMKRRMMAAVSKATVVVTNPTHYAIALQYESGMPAPVCLAKGIDELARRIRAVAEEHHVPIVENPPLARALHATVDIDAEISVEHYKAVAEVIGYVLRLRGRAA